MENSTDKGIVILRRFRDLPEALLAKTILESADIECFLCDENIVRLDWFYSRAIGGMRLWVREEDASAAEELLAQDVLQESGSGSVEPGHTPSK